MARPRAFDLDEALDQAQRVFWERGYDATTTAELAAAMGIQKGSLFHAFGDKRSLFVETLRRYMEKRKADMIERVSGSRDPLGALQDWVEHSVDVLASEEGRVGCFGVNSSVGLAARDPELADLMADYWNQFIDYFTRTIARAQQLGHVRHDLDPKVLAHLVLVNLAGMNVIARQGLADDRMRDSVSELFDSFRPAFEYIRPAAQAEPKQEDSQEFSS